MVEPSSIVLSFFQAPFCLGLFFLSPSFFVGKVGLCNGATPIVKPSSILI